MGLWSPLAGSLNDTFCTNRKSVCGHHPSVQVLIEDVKVWRRVAKPDSQPASSHQPAQASHWHSLPEDWKKEPGDTKFRRR